jgi:hypothetical protein
MPDKEKTVNFLMEKLGLSKEEANGRVEKIVVEPGSAEKARQERLKSKNHIHRVKRVNIGSREKPYLVYMCMDGADVCTSYFRPIHMLNKLVRCWACRTPFTFTSRNVEQAMPRCLNPACAMPKSPQAKEKHKESTQRKDVADDILKKLLG